MITLLVSVPDGGADKLEFLVECARRTATGPFLIHATYQNEVPKADHVIRVLKEPSTYFHANSVTHSRCINELFRSLKTDIGVICDYDTAFVYPGWDEVIAKAMSELDMWGAPYDYHNGIQFNVSGGQVVAMKYQGMPNAIFLCFRKDLKSKTSRLCDFPERFGPDDLPLQFIATKKEQEVYGIKVGWMMHVDTGARIPKIIHDYGLKAGILTRRTCDYGVMSEVSCKEIQKPEEYWNGSKPFLVHYRKASSAEKENYTFADFKRDVSRYIDGLAHD